MYSIAILFLIPNSCFLQKKYINAHYKKPNTEPKPATDYLCLESGHNDLADKLSEYLEFKFQYEIDVVSY